MPEITEVLVADRGGKWKGRELWFRCPKGDHHSNGDQNPSARFHVEKRTWFCDVGQVGGGEKDLKELLGLVDSAAPSAINEVATYDYQDERGKLLFQVVRYEPKTFRQRRPDGKGGWSYGVEGVRKVLYRTPDLAAGQDPVLVVEGEKDVETARTLGFTAVTNVGGAGKWRDEYSRQLRGRTVVVIPDNDDVGIKHAADAVTSIAQHAKLVATVTLPDGKDLSEWAGDAPPEEKSAELSALIQTKMDDAVRQLGIVSLSDAADRAMTEVDYIRKNGYDLKWGIQALDDRLGGIRRKRLYVIGGWTSHGKTAFALNVVYRALLDGKRVLYFAMENPDEIAPRLSALHKNVSMEWFVKPHQIVPAEYETLGRGLASLKEFGDRLAIVKPKELSLVKQAVAAYRPDIVVMDYLQRWVMSMGGKDDEYRLSIGRAVSAFTDIAQDNNCTAFVLSQLARKYRDPRQSTKPEDQQQAELAAEPKIGDLKESGDIENFADDILLVYWPYKDMPNAGVTNYKVILGKLKMGETGRVGLTIEPSTNRIK